MIVVPGRKPGRRPPAMPKLMTALAPLAKAA